MRTITNTISTTPSTPTTPANTPATTPDNISTPDNSFGDNAWWVQTNLGGTLEDATRLLEVPEALALVEEAEEFTQELRRILRGFQRTLGIPGDTRADLEAFLREELKLHGEEAELVLEVIPGDTMKVPTTLEGREHLWDIVEGVPNIRPIIGPDSVFLGDRLSRGGTTGDLERAVLSVGDARLLEEGLGGFNPWRRAYGRGLWHAIQREPRGEVFEETVWKALRSVLFFAFGWDVEVSTAAVESLRKRGGRSAAEVAEEIFEKPFGVITLGLWLEAEEALRVAGTTVPNRPWRIPFRFEGSSRVLYNFVVLVMDRPEDMGAAGMKPEAAKRHPANAFLRRYPAGLATKGYNLQVALPRTPNTDLGALVRRRCLLEEALESLRGLLEADHWLALPASTWDNVLVGGLTPLTKTTHGDLLCSQFGDFLGEPLVVSFERLLGKMGSCVNTTLKLEYPEEDSIEPMVVYHRDLWKVLAGTSKPTRQTLRKFAQDRLGVKLPSSGGELLKLLTAIKGQVLGLATKFPAEDFERQVRWGDEDDAREFFLEAYTNFPPSRTGFECISPGVMGSCMRYERFDSWRGYSIGTSEECDFDHPVVAYLTEDIGLVRVVHKPTGYTVARALINGKRRKEGREPTLCRIYSVGFSRVPLTEQALSHQENTLWQEELLGVLKGSEGWATKQDLGLDGCRMVPQVIQEGVIVAPYIDGGATWLTERSEGVYIVDTYGDYECCYHNPPVVLMDSSKMYCERCELHYHEDDMLSVVINRHGGIQYWCDGCAEHHTFWCYGCSQRFSEDVSGFSSDHDLCEECFSAVAMTCPNCEELIHQDDFDDTPVLWNTCDDSRVPECLCNGCMRYSTVAPCISCGENCLEEVLTPEGVCQWCAEEAATEETL